MTTTRLQSVLPRPLAPFRSEQERDGHWWEAVRNAYMLDTSAGQATILAATANAFDVPIYPMNRRVQEGYHPFDDDLAGYENYLDEFANSTSPEETMMIKQMIDNNLDLRTNLEDWGGWRFATGLLDPVNLIPVPFAIGKGFAHGAWTAMKKGAPIIGATELARHVIDPTSTAEETLFNTVGGTLFMGLMGGGIGLVPKDSMTVGAALNKLTPARGTTAMFAGIPFGAGRGGVQGMFGRMTKALKSAAGYGEPSWKKVDPESVEFKVNDDYGESHLVVQVTHKETGHVILEGISNGKAMQINSVFAPPGQKQQGFGSYAVKEAVEYAEKNGLKIVSDTAMTEDAMFFWKALDKQGYKIKENPNWEKGGKGGRRSTDGEPLFEAVQQVDPERVQVSPEMREALTELKGTEDRLHMEMGILSKAVKELKQKVKRAPKAGGAKTKAKNALKEQLAELNRVRDEYTIAKSQHQDMNVKAAQLLDEMDVEDWDLLPVGYDKILGKLNQFPWWRLIKTPLRTTHPELAVKLQMYAFKMASTPGLNNKGNKLKHTTGPNVESLTIEYTGRWLSATREAQRIYRKYAGHGESSGQVKHFVIDQSQRVRATARRLSGKEKTDTTNSGKLTAAAFEDQVSIAISEGGAHQVPEVAKAAAGYMKVLKELGEEAKALEVTATQRNIRRQLSKIDQDIENFNAKWKDKYDVQAKSLDEQQAEFDTAQKKLKENPDDAEAKAAVDEAYAVFERKPPLPPALQATRDRMDLDKMGLLEDMEAYKATENTSYIHRLWKTDEVVKQEALLKTMLFKEFEANPKEIILDANGMPVKEHPEIIQARVNEAYASILRDAEVGGNLDYMPNSPHTRDWLEARKALISEDSSLPARTREKQIEIIDRKLDRIAKGTEIGPLTGPLIGRKLNLNNTELLKAGLIEGNVNTWMNHYVMRIAPIIETARVFGDGRAQGHIDELIFEIIEAANKAEKAGNMNQAKMLMKEAEESAVAMNNLRDIVHGTFAIPDNPDAITPRVLRMLRNFNILGAMGRSVMMAVGDMGNVVASQGLARSLGHAFNHFASGITDGKIKMMRDEVDLAGSVSEVILGMRYHQMTDFGQMVGSSAKHPTLSKAEQGLANMSQRFFLYNLLGPWTDMARRFSGGMLQSRLIENSIAWKSGSLSDDQITIMGRLGISKEQAIQFADEWAASGSTKHDNMFIAGTADWVSDQARRTFRAAMNTEINRMVPTPGAVDKPIGLLKSEWWKVIGQYRGFSIAATHRIMGAGIHEKGAQKFSGLASMVGIAMMVDAYKRPDYIQMPLDEQILRAVELSGVTGIILDLNDTIERASAGSIGLRPSLGMDIRERNPNWANRMGTIGAVPNQWLTLMYGLTSDEAETSDTARAIRYMIPYNNLIWWNEVFNRTQRATVDFIEDREQ